MAKDFIWVVYDKNDDGSINLLEAYSTNENAKAAVKQLKAKGSSNVESKKLELKSSGEAAASNEKASGNAKAKSSKKAQSPEKVVEDEDDDRDDIAVTEKAAPKKKKEPKEIDESVIPNGKPGALDGLKIIFTGTFKIDRKHCEHTVKKYGASVPSKMDNTDYVIIGTKPGDKKLQEIESKSLDTMNEIEFYDMLKTGMPEVKRKQVAARAAAAADGEPAMKKQKK